MKKTRRIKRERFELMAIRVAAYLMQSPPVDDFLSIPPTLRNYLELLTYCELVRPLVHHDRVEKGRTIPELSISYEITIQEVKTILSKKAVVL